MVAVRPVDVRLCSNQGWRLNVRMSSNTVGADLAVMATDTIRMRTNANGLKPFVMTNLKTKAGLAEVVAFIEAKGMLERG